MRPLHQPPFYAEITAALAPGLSVDDERIRWSIRDVTERKQAEEMLRQSEETFRAIGELNPFGVWECDAEGGILYLSQSWLDMTGKSLEESKQFGWMERYAPGEGEKMLEAWRRTLKSGERWEYEHHIIDKNGKDRWVLCRGFPMRDRQGQIARWIGLNIDITQQKRAALELRELNKTLDRRVAERTADLFESETRYKSLFEAIDEGFCVIEVIFDENGKPPDYRFLKTNPAFVKHTGLQDAVGKRMREIEPRHERHWFETYGRVAMTGAPERFVNEARYLGGRWYDGYAFRIGRPEERKVAVLFNDITERKRTREALAESEIRFRNLSESLAETVREKTAELLQVEHLAAVGMMVATVAHEIRNPVQVIRSGVDFLRVASPHDEKARQELIAEIEYGAERVEGTLLDLLAYARPVDLKLSSVTVGGSVEGGLKLVTGKLKAINTTVELENPDEKIQVDFQKFTQVLGNILSNAADAMPNSGNLTIQSRAAKRDEEKFLEISITDTGSGIDEKHLGKIFKPFYTTKTRGTGLGLSLSKRIMDAHGGNMSITSKMGVGTTVVLRIPLRKSSSP